MIALGTKRKSEEISAQESPSKQINRYLDTAKLSITPLRTGESSDKYDTPFIQSLVGVSAAKLKLEPLMTGDELINRRAGTPKLMPNTPISKRYNSSKKIFGLRKEGADKCKFITREVGKDEEGNLIQWRKVDLILMKNAFQQYSNEGKTLIQSLALISRRLGGKDIRDIAYRLKQF